MTLYLYLFALIAGAAMFANASYFYWRIGQKDGIGRRWLTAPGMTEFWVLVILGGWAGGVTLVVKALMFLVLGS
jgi:hypothetical protein